MSHAPAAYPRIPRHLFQSIPTSQRSIKQIYHALLSPSLVAATICIILRHAAEDEEEEERSKPVFISGAKKWTLFSISFLVFFSDRPIPHPPPPRDACPIRECRANGDGGNTIPSSRQSVSLSWRFIDSSGRSSLSIKSGEQAREEAALCNA